MSLLHGFLVDRSQDGFVHLVSYQTVEDWVWDLQAALPGNVEGQHGPIRQGEACLCSRASGPWIDVSENLSYGVFGLPTIMSKDVQLAAEAPVLQLCVLNDDVLTLPRDVRMLFLQDPVRSVEWKEILREFDQTYSANSASAAAAECANPSGPPEPQFDWSSHFAGEPNFEQSKIKGKYALAGVQNVTCYVVVPADYVEPSGDDDAEGPKYQFWVSASTNTTIPDTVPILTYGPGTWVLDGRAQTALTETPEKVVLCEFHSCEDQVILEDWESLHRTCYNCCRVSG